VSTAQRLYREQSGKDVGFAFGFDKDHPIKNEKVLASSIAGLAKVLSHEPPGVVLRERYRHIPELSFWYQSEAPNKGAPWQVSQIYKTEIMSIEGLKKSLQTRKPDRKATSRATLFGS
jgi:hypothetical protein